MPQIGETRKGDEIGKGRPSFRYIWSACEICGKERWVYMVHRQPVSPRCASCCKKGNTRNKGMKGSKNPNWKGGIHKGSDGYIRIIIQPDDFFYPMVDGHNYVMEHRLIMARHLSRCLLPWEIVHHRNGIKTDNRIENLILAQGQTNHIVDSIVKSRMRRLEKQIAKLQVEIKVLQKAAQLPTVETT